MHIKIATTLLLGASFLATCKSNSKYEIHDESQLADTSGLKHDTPKLCAAIRGNGNLIMAHFGALARIVELFGLIDGGAGGSSASITLFIYESIYSNKLVRECGGQAACSDEERAARTAFLLKSTLGYLQVLGNTAESVALKFLFPIARALRQSDIEQLLKSDPEAARANINALLKSEDLFSHADLTSLVNQEFLAFLNGSADPHFRANEAYQAIAEFGDFKISDKRVLLRPGVLDFAMIATLVGYIGDFYAGLVDTNTYEGMRGLLARCAVRTRGQDWLSIAQSACGGQFHDLVARYRELRREHQGSQPLRIEQPIGKHLPLLPITAVITGKTAIAGIDAAQRAYLANATPTLSTTTNFNIDFARNIHFGYWGPTPSLNRAAAFLRTQKDLKSQKFLPLGPGTWREAIQLSPAEPGLAAIQPLRDMRSAAGWADLHPVQVLKGIGCGKVIYITRQGEESGFATGIASQLGMQAAQQRAMYALRKGSSFQNALDMADAIWCTNWNQFSGAAGGDVAAHMLHGYNAPLISNDPMFQKNRSGYLYSTKTTQAIGCHKL